MDALAQVDLGTRRHSHQPDAALGRMAGQIVQTALARSSGIGCRATSWSSTSGPAAASRP